MQLATDTTHLSGRLVDELSGGQRQRARVAMAPAQHADILLLDEPTTFLDIAHQIEWLEPLTDLHYVGHTLVAVVVPDPAAGTPQVVPLGRDRGDARCRESH
jgi:iron complex transport system ATP-binding protein